MVRPLVSAALVSAIVQRLGPIIDSELTLIANVKEEVRKLDSKFRIIQAVLNDAEKRRMQEEAVKLWLDKLKDVCSKMHNLLNEWDTLMVRAQQQQEEQQQQQEEEEQAERSTATWKVWRLLWPLFNFIFSGRNPFQHRDYALKIKEINENLDEIIKEKEMYGSFLTMAPEEVERPKTTSFVDVAEIQGRDQYEFRGELVSSLLGNGDEEERSPHVISLVGTDGTEKTTLAQVAFNDDEVQAHFEIKIWICVSNHFDQCKVAREILESLEGQSPNITALQSLLNRIRDKIQGKKFFLVLDDVWTEDSGMWNPFKIILNQRNRGSRILVTTHKQRVAVIMGSARVFNLPSPES